MDISALELKFLLRLLTFAGSSSPISQVRLNQKTAASERDRVCQALCSKGLVGFSEIIKRFGITPAGRTLLNLDTSALPVTPDELLILRASLKGLQLPGNLPAKVPATSRQRLLQGLQQRGLIKVHSTQIKTVWLTPQGQQFLLNDCQPQGHAPTLSLSLLGTYLQFLRQHWSAGSTTSSIEPTAAPALTSPTELLNLIAELDRAHGGENHLPLFHLRQAAQLPRPTLDQMLYQLQRNNRIELGTLQEVAAYSPQQLEAGIAQDVGGSLFFVSLI
jgi:hypothetical protein